MGTTRLPVLCGDQVEADFQVSDVIDARSSAVYFVDA